MLTGPPTRVLELVGAPAADVVVLKDVPEQNASWLIGTELILRRYHHRATAADLAYEHAVLPGPLPAIGRQLARTATTPLQGNR